MPLTNTAGVRIHRCPPEGKCRMNISKGPASGFARVRGGPQGAQNFTEVAIGRATDKRIAEEAANAVWRGNPVKIGVNTRDRSGINGIGRVFIYRPYSPGVVKYDNDNRSLGMYENVLQTYNDILQELRGNHFRVIAFGDPKVFRPYSQIHPHSIAYTVPVSSRLTHEPVGTLTCQLSDQQYDVRSVFEKY